ncbi:MAG: preprotein translocase subunit SecG [Oscillospiraceae bacterium]|nr:preprotein translocase subunit SecG [Oscillospiraceae bacterium]
MLKIVLTVLLVIASAALLTVVLMQPSKSEGLTLFTGVKDTHFSQHKGRTREAFLWKLTIAFAIIWAILCGAMAFV